MPVYRVAPRGVRAGRNSHISQPCPCGRRWFCSQRREAFHVSNDTKVSLGILVTIETKVANGTSTEREQITLHAWFSRVPMAVLCQKVPLSQVLPHEDKVAKTIARQTNSDTARPQIFLRI
jgi:hypothetical protein